MKTSISTNLVKSESTSRPVQLRREIAQSGFVQGLDMVERKIFLASTETPLSEYSEAILLACMTADLRNVCNDVGCRINEGEWTKTVMRIADFIKQYYPNLSRRDISLAFELSLAGELDDFLPKTRDGYPDRNHYQIFSLDYVTKIINAYLGRRGWVIKKAYDSRPKPKQIASGDEYGDVLRRDFYNAFLEFKYRGRLPDISAIAEMLYYQILERVGLADEIEVTEKEQSIIMFRTIRDYLSRGMNYDAERVRREGPESSELQKGAYNLARRKALIEVFKRLVKEEIQLSDYIYGNENEDFSGNWNRSRC